MKKSHIDGNMVKDRQNYCQILGLNPQKESSYTVEAILKIIETKKNKWINDSINRQNDTEQRFKSHKLVSMTDDMIHVMTDPTLRNKEFSDGVILLKSKVQKLRQECIILSNGISTIPNGVAENYIKKIHWDNIQKTDIIKLAEIGQDTPPQPVSDMILNAYNGLRSVDAYTPSEMLNDIIVNPNLNIDLDPLSDNSPYNSIRSAFEVCSKRVNNIRSDILPEQDSYIMSMRNIKLILNSDEQLSDLITYGKCNRALIKVMEIIELEYNNQLDRAYIDELLNVFSTSNVNAGMAIQILQMFCFKKKIAANFSYVENKMIRCLECGSMIRKDPSIIFCPFCGKNLNATCPICRTIQSPKNLVCTKCGFNFGNGFSMAKKLEIKFYQNIQRGMLAEAERNVNDIREVCFEYPNMSSIELQLKKSKESMLTMYKMILDCYSHNKFSETKNIFESLVKQFPCALINNSELKQKYEDSINRFNTADAYCQKAKFISINNQKIKLYITALEICPDHPTVKIRLNEHPPHGPTHPIGSFKDESFTIKFRPPLDDESIVYCIYREIGSFPILTDKINPIAEVASCEYIDRTMDSGIEYYYSIYSMRQGVTSIDGAHIGPITLLAEVYNVNIEPIDNSGLHISFNKRCGQSRVRLWRSEDIEVGNTATEIFLDGKESYNDINLKKNHRYYYLFVIEYDINNSIQRSHGKIFSATTIDAPEPVHDMEIKLNEDNTFTARWSTSERVTLFNTQQEIELSRNIVRMSDIKASMTEIEPIRRYSNGIDFSISGCTVQYLYPIISCGEFGIKGDGIMIANLRPFRDIRKIVSNNDCIITMNWPNDAVEAKIVISDSEAKDPNCMDAEVKTVGRDEYMSDGMIKIPINGSATKYINMFANYKINGKMIASRGIIIKAHPNIYKKVRYILSVERGLMNIKFLTDTDERIPSVIAIKATRGIPLKKNEGTVVWRSQSHIQTVNGNKSFITNYEPSCGTHNIRMFFEEEDSYCTYRFVHPIYRDEG